jgi:hypothetical protein
MEAVRRANPKFTNFKSNTAVDAVEQFCRMQRNGLSAQVIPEALIECAKGLNDTDGCSSSTEGGGRSTAGSRLNTNATCDCLR